MYAIKNGTGHRLCGLHCVAVMIKLGNVYLCILPRILKTTETVPETEENLPQSIEIRDSVISMKTRTIMEYERMLRSYKNE